MEDNGPLFVKLRSITQAELSQGEVSGTRMSVPLF